ncbi:MAG: N-acetylneuraminate synthase family protein [Nitrospirae bacterium]|nr:N-acetylneuraminate synthase family protein [Nitrospirota bacterium]
MEFDVQGKKIGDGHPVFFIAEAGVNHNGSLELGYKLIDAALGAGADAIKFQTFKADKLNTKNAPKSSYHVETTGSDDKQTWYELLKTQELSKEQHLHLKSYCDYKGIIFLSTPYDEESADMLNEIGLPLFKLASTDTNNIPFVRHIAKKGKPIIISTAFCEMVEVQAVVNAIRSEGVDSFVVLQCTGNYPAILDDSHLNVISTYRKQLRCLVGYSDHAFGSINAIASTALGSCVYEKHFTIDKLLPGPDHRMSLVPAELKETIHAVRLTERALGSPEKRTLPSEAENRIKLRKSVVAAHNIAKGTVLKREMVEFKRPGTGISPAKLDDFIGRILKVDLQIDSILREDMF